MTKRPIAPMKIPGVAPAVPRGSKPEMTWLAPTDILVEERYQRGIGERGRKLIASIYGGFDWRLYRLPICAYTPDGIEAIDGQHTLLAAASLGIPEVPVLIVGADAIENRAELFVSVNADRLALSRAQLHVAKVLAGDAGAMRIEALCARHGVKLMRAQPAGGRYKPRESIAIQTIASLLRRYEEDDVERIVEAVANTDAAPVSAVLLRAAECLLTDPEFANDVDPALITAAALSLPGMGEQEAKLFAATHNVPVWRALASVWFKASKKLPKRPAPKASTVPAEPAYVPPARRPLPASTGRFGVRPSFEPAAFHHGDPPPGRSALDARRAQP